MITRIFRRFVNAKWILYLVVIGFLLFFIGNVIGYIFREKGQNEFENRQNQMIIGINDVLNQRVEKDLFEAQVDSLIKTNNVEAAINLIKGRMQKYPADKSELYSRIGEIYLSCDKFDSSLLAFSNSISLNENNEIAYAKRAECYSKMGSINKAIPDLIKASSINSDYYYLLGLYQEKLGLYDDSKESYRRYLNQYPSDSICRQRLDRLEK